MTLNPMRPWCAALVALTLGCSDPKTHPGGDAVDGTATNPAAALGGDAASPGLTGGEGSASPAQQSAEGAAEPAVACADVQTTPVRSVPSVTFLVDGSSSMKCVYPEDSACDCERQIRGQCLGQGAISRWHALKEALFGDGTAPGLVETRGQEIQFGLWIYNDGPTSPSCPAFPAQVGPALSQDALLAGAFPDAPPGYNTPTGPALSALANTLPNADDKIAQQLGPQKIVLATDGQPFVCYDPVTLAAPALDYGGALAAAVAAEARGIDVFVLSLAPTTGDYADHLDEVARAGHSEHAYAPSDKAALSAALDDIIASSISCTVTLNGAIQHPEVCTGEATLGDSTLRCDDSDGFSIADESHVTLNGAACERFKREPGVALNMTFPCDSLQLH